MRVKVGEKDEMLVRVEASRASESKELLVAMGEVVRME